MSHTLLLVTGQDRPGIVGAVSGLLSGCGANLEDLRMSILEGQLAMMLIVDMPRNARPLILKKLEKIKKKWRLNIFECALGRPEKATRHKNTNQTAVILRIIGKDRSGIVAGISQTLARHRCNITDLQCRRLGAGHRAYYTMVLECTVPSRTVALQMPRLMKPLAKKLAVDITVQSADIVPL